MSETLAERRIGELVLIGAGSKVGFSFPSPMTAFPLHKGFSKHSLGITGQNVLVLNQPFPTTM